ncbi:MAG: DUF6062 family protein [Anaerolineae bacterium]|jgi:hypothetical protein
MKRLFGGEKSLLIAQLLDALAGDICPVCARVAEAERRHLDLLLHDQVNDGRTRAMLAASRGFCPEHTALLLEVGGRGCHAKIALLYAAQVAALADEVERLPDQGGPNGALQTACPACANIARTERLYVELLAQRMAEPRFREALAAGPGLCLTHLRQVYALAAPRERALLRQMHASSLRALSRDLREFARKSAQVAQGIREPFGDERDAWIRALRLYHGDLPG